MRVINMHQQYVYLKELASSVNSMFMDKSSSGLRLRSLLEERGIQFNEFAASLGLPAQNINNWFVRGVPQRMLRNVSMRLQISQEWLEEGIGERDMKGASQSVEDGLAPISVWDDETPLEDDEVEIPFLREVELSAGSGKTVIEQSSRMKLRFGKYTLRRKGVEPANAVAVPVKGNSMEPVLPDGSTVGVDRGATGIVDGKMYAINDGGLLRVKTLYRLPGNRVRIRSYNRDEYEDEERDLEEITVIGRVFWYSVLL